MTEQSSQLRWTLPWNEVLYGHSDDETSEAPRVIGEVPRGSYNDLHGSARRARTPAQPLQE